MNTLLILGSKPDPSLPTADAYDAVACANASGYSAARHGMPVPTFTVMSAILTSGIESGKQSLNALSGLKTDTLYFFPRPPVRKKGIKGIIQHTKRLKTGPLYFRFILRSLPFHYQSFANMPWNFYHDTIASLCDHDDQIMDRLKLKQPSSGIITLAVGLARYHFDRYIMSGFSFELTHAYAHNPEITERGSQGSKHTDTDIMIIRYLHEKYRNIYTTESVVHQRTGIPLLV